MWLSVDDLDLKVVRMVVLHQRLVERMLNKHTTRLKHDRQLETCAVVSTCSSTPAAAVDFTSITVRVYNL